ncbi:MAG: regulator, partial [Flavobacteriaceae bacterium]
MKKWLWIFCYVFSILACSKNEVTPTIEVNDDLPVNNPPENPSSGMLPCIDGMAGIYPCNGFDLVGAISLSGFNAGSGNDSWGWT